MASSVDRNSAVTKTAPTKKTSATAAPAKTAIAGKPKAAAASGEKFASSIVKAQAASSAAPKPTQTTAGKPLPPSQPIDAKSANDLVVEARNLNVKANTEVVRSPEGDDVPSPQGDQDRRAARAIAQSVTANQSGANQLLPADAAIHNTGSRIDNSTSPQAFGLGAAVDNPLTTSDRASYLANDGDMQNAAGKQLQADVTAQLYGLNRGAVDSVGAPLQLTSEQAKDRAGQYTAEAQGRINPTITDPTKRQQFDGVLQAGLADYVNGLPPK